MGRSSNGRSSIYLGSDGYWHGWVTMGTRPDGRPDRRHVMRKEQGDVTDRVQELEGQRDKGEVTKPGKPPKMADWLRTWLTTIAPRTASESTIDSTYRPKVEGWIIPAIGNQRIDKLQPEHLDQFYLSLKKGKLSSKSILMIHQIISRALKMAVRRRMVGVNVATMVDPPKVRETEIEPLEDEEARKIIEACRERRNGIRWIIALCLGLRQCEALGIRWSCLNLEKRTIRVYQLKRSRYRHGCASPYECVKDRHITQKCKPKCETHEKRCPKVCRDNCELHAQYCPERTGGEWAFREPKGGRARTLTLPLIVVRELELHRAAQEAERKAAGTRWKDWGLTFAQPTGKPIDPREDWEEWKDILKESGIRDARVHDARHTAATIMLEQGVDLSVVQEVLGHSNPTMTRRYAKVRGKLTTLAADRMSAALLEAPTDNCN